MPLLEALDNDGKRTGRTRIFTNSEYQRLMRLKRPMWVLVSNDTPKRRGEQDPSEIPAEKVALLDFISRCDDVKTLDKIIATDGRKSIREEAIRRKENVTNKN